MFIIVINEFIERLVAVERRTACLDAWCHWRLLSTRGQRATVRRQLAWDESWLTSCPCVTLTVRSLCRARVALLWYSIATVERFVIFGLQQDYNHCTLSGNLSTCYSHLCCRCCCMNCIFVLSTAKENICKYYINAVFTVLSGITFLFRKLNGKVFQYRFSAIWLVPKLLCCCC